MNNDTPLGRITNRRITAGIFCPLVMFVAIWAALLALMVVQKPLFMLFEPAYSLDDMSHVYEVVWHGLSMDVSMSAYMASGVLVWLIVSTWLRTKQRAKGDSLVSRSESAKTVNDDKEVNIADTAKPSRTVLDKILSVYLWLCAGLIGIAALLDAVLFPFWSFRLDSTPLFYFMTSPSAAFASLPWWLNIIVLVAMACMVCLFGLWLRWVRKRVEKLMIDRQTPLNLKWRVIATVVYALVGALMIIPIRGGVTVSTMSPGHAYFSDDMRLNQAAVNPLFNFLYSLSHNANLEGQFRWMDDKSATSLSEMMTAPGPSDASISSQVSDIKLNTANPDVYVIILESFSAHLMKSLGGEDIATNLNRLAGEEGVLFTRFYAESFRTDRAIPAIISGYPAQPTTSLLRFINKFPNMPSLASALGEKGYTSRYYYGGDIDFTNVKAYLIAGGWNDIISDVDFEASKRGGKWGVQDGDLFARVLADSLAAGPNLVAIQTSSSHEPYEVPARLHHDKRINAFAYADSCLGGFIDGLKQRGRWENSLIVIVPDHWGSYPEGLTDYEARHHIPLVLTGGALTGTPCVVEAIGSQSAILPTITDLIGATNPTKQLSMLDPRRPQLAWLSEPDWYGLMTPRGLSVIDAVSGRTLRDSGDITNAKAFIQKLYDDLNSR